MLQQETFTFLSELADNNNREWMHAHKDAYLAAKQDVEDFAGDLITRVSRFEERMRPLEPKQTMFRLHRDVRFSKNKLPYKTHFGIVIGPRGRKSPEAMYYLHISPDECFIAGGKWHPEKDQLAAIRASIAKNDQPLRKILNAKKYKQLFREMSGQTLKTAPRDYDKEHPAVDLLRHKDFLSVHHFAPSTLLSKDAGSEVAKLFKAMKPFNDFLNQAMGY